MKLTVTLINKLMNLHASLFMQTRSTLRGGGKSGTHHDDDATQLNVTLRNSRGYADVKSFLTLMTIMITTKQRNAT